MLLRVLVSTLAHLPSQTVGQLINHSVNSKHVHSPCRAIVGNLSIFWWGIQFSKRLHCGGGVNFENAQNVRRVEILRHRAGLLQLYVKVVKLYYD